MASPGRRRRPSPAWKPAGSSTTLPPGSGAAAALVVAGAVWGLARYYPERILTDDWKSLVATLRAYGRADDAVVLYTDKDWPVFSYHYPGQWQKTWTHIVPVGIGRSGQTGLLFYAAATGHLEIYPVFGGALQAMVGQATIEPNLSHIVAEPF